MKNILIVDDKNTFLQLFLDTLKASHPHFNVLGTQNGKKAVEILESGPVDLVVADLRMPEMDGFELPVYLNSRFPSIPAIVMSAYCAPELKERPQTFGTLRFLSKPMDLWISQKGLRP